jgi:hypothetical protein
MPLLRYRVPKIARHAALRHMSDYDLENQSRKCYFRFCECSACSLSVPVSAVLDLIPCATAQVPPQARKMVFGEREQRSMNLALALIRRLYPRLPMRIRAVGPYQEALARLRGERQPDLAVRWLNRLWIGRPMMK